MLLMQELAVRVPHQRRAIGENVDRKNYRLCPHVTAVGHVYRKHHEARLWDNTMRQPLESFELLLMCAVPRGQSPRWKMTESVRMLYLKLSSSNEPEDSESLAITRPLTE